MPLTKFTDLDFDQIKASIKSYLRANSNFTDFDFEGSNFAVLIDTLAYNTYITAFNSNMVVNESFIDSATLRENVVSLARNIGYVPRSRKSAQAQISFNIQYTGTSPTVTLSKGLVCVGDLDNSSVVFSIPEDITTNSVDERFLNKALSIVETNISVPIFGVEELAKEMSVSRVQLYRKIRAITGQSAAGFVRSIRLNRAAQLLKQKHDNIGRIAYEVGFSNPSYFSSSFYKQFGMYPTEYVEQSN